MKYIKLFEVSNVTKKVTDGNFLEVDDIVYHPKFGEGRIINMRSDKVIAEILFFDYIPNTKYLRIDVAELQIDKNVYDLRIDANKYNL